MTSFADALRVLNDMEGSGVVEEYAVAGAMAMVFWAEPIPTYDLGVLVFLPGDESTIVNLAPLYDWAAERGCPAQAEHVMIAGVPVQFLPAHNRLAEEPEYLVALYLEPGARTLKRRERAAALMESGALDRAALDELLERFGLEP